MIVLYLSRAGMVKYHAQDQFNCFIFLIHAMSILSTVCCVVLLPYNPTYNPIQN